MAFFTPVAFLFLLSVGFQWQLVKAIAPVTSKIHHVRILTLSNNCTITVAPKVHVPMSTNSDSSCVEQPCDVKLRPCLPLDTEDGCEHHCNAEETDHVNIWIHTMIDVCEILFV